jgi:hypothetical protein
MRMVIMTRIIRTVRMTRIMSNHEGKNDRNVADENKSLTVPSICDLQHLRRQQKNQAESKPVSTISCSSRLCLKASKSSRTAAASDS